MRLATHYLNRYLCDDCGLNKTDYNLIALTFDKRFGCKPNYKGCGFTVKSITATNPTTTSALDTMHRTMHDEIFKKAGYRGVPKVYPINYADNFIDKKTRDREYGLDKPPVMILKSQYTLRFTGKRCAICGQATEKRCSRCKKINYCCREHQKLDWPRHKQSCR